MSFCSILQGVRIVGDNPIFIAQQGAKVWARPDLFELDGADSPTGERWGNPLNRWLAHRAEQGRWVAASGETDAAH